MFIQTIHPVVLFVYFGLTLFMTMIGMQPVLVIISLVGGMLASSMLVGWHRTIDAFRWQIPILILITLSNPLFSSLGTTVLIRVFGHAVTVESLMFGVTMGVLFVSTLIWFTVASRVITAEQVLSVFSSLIPILAMMISMIMRLIPKFIRKSADISDAEKVALGRVNPSNFLPQMSQEFNNSKCASKGIGWMPCRNVVGDQSQSGKEVFHSLPLSYRIPFYIRDSSVLMSWGMEDSLEIADSMRVRGWQTSKPRSRYKRYRMRGTDICALVFLILFGCISCLVCWSATAQFKFYPTMSHLLIWWGYIVYALWMSVPCCIQIYERLTLRRMYADNKQ